MNQLHLLSISILFHLSFYTQLLNNNPAFKDWLLPVSFQFKDPKMAAVVVLTHPSRDIDLILFPTSYQAVHQTDTVMCINSPLLPYYAGKKNITPSKGSSEI